MDTYYVWMMHGLKRLTCIQLMAGNQSRPRKRLCDLIPVDMKSLNLSNQGSYRIYDFFSLLFMTFTTTKDINFHDHFLNLVLVLLT